MKASNSPFVTPMLVCACFISPVQVYGPPVS